MSTPDVEFSGVKGRFFAWFLNSPLRKVLEWKMGTPEPRLFELLALRGDEVVVDSGCGSGFHSLLVAERLDAGRVIGFDVSEAMLDRFRRDAARRGLASKAEARHGDALALPLDDEVADRAITLAAWHHLPDPAAACAELARVLRPGGRLVAVDLEIAPRARVSRHLEGHDRAFGPDTMEVILRGAGLRERRVERVGRWVVGSAVK